MTKAHFDHDPQITKHIFVVEDHPIFLRGLTDLIEQEPDLCICGTSCDVLEAMNKIREINPDLVILDLALKSSNGLDLIDMMKRENKNTPVLVLSTYDEKIYAERCIKAGAMGYINKKEASDCVINAVRTISAGNIYLSHDMTTAVLNKFRKKPGKVSASPLELLTNRELEVFNLIGKGYTPSAIANRLHLSAKTVYSHTEKIKNKLNIEHSAELSRIAALWSVNGTK